MPNAWFRLYSEFATDPKVQMMSEANQRRFIMVLCMRCSNDRVTLQDEEVAFQLRISNEEWTATKAVFLAKDLINEDNSPTAWDKRQFVSDSSAERVAKHRAKKKAACNVTVTPPDTDTDTEVDVSNDTSVRSDADAPLPDHAEQPARKPDCPAQAIVDLYHQHMPENPRCKVLNDARKGAIRARWKEAATLSCKPFGYSNRADGLAAWAEFFSICADSPFLTGKALAQPGKPPFMADIDFLMSPSGFAKCLENKYHREAA